MTMPVSVARKIEFELAASGANLDIQLRPVVLTHASASSSACHEHRSRHGKTRAEFEERFGGGATELDALEALHPGVLQEILRDEILRYRDMTSTTRSPIAEQRQAELESLASDITRAVHDAHRDDIDALITDGMKSSNGSANGRNVQDQFGRPSVMNWSSELPRCRTLNGQNRTRATRMMTHCSTAAPLPRPARPIQGLARQALTNRRGNPCAGHPERITCPRGRPSKHGMDGGEGANPMRLNRLPPEILKLLPPPGDDDLSPGIMEKLSPADRRKVLSLLPREKPEVMIEIVAGWADEMPPR